MSVTPNYASHYDLRGLSVPILDQGSEGSCEENAVVADIGLMMQENGHPVSPLSRQQLYNDQRTLINKFDTDYGSYTSTTLQVAKNTGIASEASFQYGDGTLFVHPSASVEAEAGQHKVTSWDMLNSDINYTTMVTEVKQMLSQGKPVLLGFMVHDYFFTESGPLNQQGNYGFTDSHGKAGHEVLIVGLDDNLNGGSYIVQNSWGTSWGDKGFGTISYKQFIPTVDHKDLIDLAVINGFNSIDTTFTANRVNVSFDYAISLHRAGEITGVDYFASKLTSGLTNSQILDGMISSGEGNAIYSVMNNVQFVESCYGSILGRHSDSGGLIAWTNLLNTGISRGTLMDDMFSTVLNMTTDVSSHNYLLDIGNVASYISIATQYSGGKDSLTSHELSLVTADANQTEIIKVGIPHDFGIV